MSRVGLSTFCCLTCATWWIFTPPGEFYPQQHEQDYFAITYILSGRKISLPSICTPKKVAFPSPEISLFQWFVWIFTFSEILIFSIRFELQYFYPRGEIFEFDNKYIIRCLLSKYQLIFLLVFLYLTRKNIMLLLTELEVHTRKYLFWHSRRMDRTQWGPCALNVRTNISCMDRNLG